MSIHDVYRYFINIIYPNRCPACNDIIEYNDTFCAICTNSINSYNKDVSINYADDVVVCCEYEDIVRLAVLRFKKTADGNAYYAFSRYIYDKLTEKGIADQIDVIAYIPMWKPDLEKRGYNQTQLMAKELHYLLNRPVSNSLIKIKQTNSQKSINNRELRRANVENAFAVKKYDDFKDKTVIIIDDLCTTGSTLSEAAKVIKAAGAKRVIAAAFAKTIYNTEKEVLDNDNLL